MPEMKVVGAIREALAEEMRRDDQVIVYGEDVRIGWTFGVTSGLNSEFGDERVFDTPMAEIGIVNSAIGAALVGMRPVVEIQFGDFITTIMDCLLNQASKWHWVTGGQLKVPIVIRTPFGVMPAMFAGIQHVQCLEPWLMYIPGLKVATPSTAADAKGLLKTAIRDDNPVFFCEYKALYPTAGEVPEGEHLVPFGQAVIRRPGKDALIVATAPMQPKALAAAETLAKDYGLDVRVLDLRTLAPLDKDTLLTCVQQTKRVVIAEEGYKTGGVGGELAAIIAEEAFEHLQAPIVRVAAKDLPIGATGNLQNFVIPGTEEIVAGVRSLFA